MRWRKFDSFGILIMFWLGFLGILTLALNLQEQSAAAIPIVDLLTNSGFRVWSQADTNKGIGSLAFDAGDGDIPDIGAVVTGATSSATGIIICITITYGTFGTGDAAGVMTLGSCAGRFQNNETLNFSSSETAVVNAPDSGSTNVGDTVQNGDFSINTDPPPGWTALNSMLTTETRGQIGNCLKVMQIGRDSGSARQSISVTSGKIFLLTVYVKEGNTTTYMIHIGSSEWGSDIYKSGYLTATGEWVEHTFVFEAISSTIALQFWCSGGDTKFVLFDEISLYEITPEQN